MLPQRLRRRRPLREDFLPTHFKNFHPRVEPHRVLTRISFFFLRRLEMA